MDISLDNLIRGNSNIKKQIVNNQKAVPTKSEIDSVRTAFYMVYTILLFPYFINCRLERFFIFLNNR